MKKIILAFFLLTTTISYSQSVEILPGNNSNGNIISNSGSFPGLNMFKSGVSNPDKMIISHSPNFNDYGLQYQDNEDEFHFVGDGNRVMTVQLDFGRNVGIGTSNPGAKLDVANSSSSGTNASLRLLHSSATGFNRLNFENLSRASKWMISANVASAATDSRWNVWHTSTGNVLTVAGDGKVGILNDNPTLPFHVNSSATSTNSSTGAAAIGSLTGFHLIFDNNEINAYNNTSGTALYLNQESNGRVEIGGSGGTASDLRVNGFTELGGSGAPNIKMKKLTGTTDADATTTRAHGLDIDKILAVEVFIYNGATVKYPPQDATGSSQSYRMYVNSADIGMANVSASLQGETYSILITYEE